MTDKAPRSLMEGDFDLDTASITFVFTETMGITSLDVTKTTVLAAAREPIRVPRGALACEVEEPQVNSTALCRRLQCSRRCLCICCVRGCGCFRPG